MKIKEKEKKEKNCKLAAAQKTRAVGQETSGGARRDLFFPLKAANKICPPLGVYFFLGASIGCCTVVMV